MAPDNHTWTNLIRKIREDISTKPEFILAWESAEKSAKTLLKNRAASLTSSDQVYFLSISNTEIVAPDLKILGFKSSKISTLLI